MAVNPPAKTAASTIIETPANIAGAAVNDGKLGSAPVAAHESCPKQEPQPQRSLKKLSKLIIQLRKVPHQQQEQQQPQSADVSSFFPVAPSPSSPRAQSSSPANSVHRRLQPSPRPTADHLHLGKSSSSPPPPLSSSLASTATSQAGETSGTSKGVLAGATVKRERVEEELRAELALQQRRIQQLEEAAEAAAAERQRLRDDAAAAAKEEADSVVRETIDFIVLSVEVSSLISHQSFQSLRPPVCQ